MIEVLITLLVVVVVFGVIWYALTLIPLPHPFQLIAQLLLVVILLIILLTYLLPLVHYPPIVR